MYFRGKKRDKFRNRITKPITLLASIAILVIGVTLPTVAFLVDSNGPVKNIFTPTQVSCEIEERFNGEVKESVKVQNTGNIEAYVRVAVIVTWKDETENVYREVPVVGEDYTITFANDGWDTVTSDGYYYYRYPVTANGMTGILIQECKPVEGKTPVGYGLSVEILAEAIQSVPTDVVEEKWGVEVASDNSISKD